MTKLGYRYLASPYTGTPEIMLARFHAVKRAMSYLLAQREWVYSPIVHCHQMAQDHSLPTDFAFWLDYNHVMINQSCGLIVLGIEGWQRSKGVTEEIEYAKSIHLEVKLVNSDGQFVRWLTGPEA